MTSYKIIVTPDAEDDLVELRNYIAGVLLAYNTAINYIRTIRNEIGSLSEMPEKYKSVDDEPWHSRGIRKVYILNVIYARRDQLRALEQMNID